MSQDATSAFVARKSEFDKLIAALQAASQDHFGAGPDDVNWGYVGTLDYANAKLAEVAEFLNLKV